MPTVITNYNIHRLVRDYVTNRNSLPEDLRDISISDWDVSHVTDMSDLFSGFSIHNINYGPPLEPGESYVLFNGFYTFNESLNNWNVSNVTNMARMFYECRNFNQDLSNWNVSNVTNMVRMFFSCRNFNQDLSNWNVSKVTNMKGMFWDCRRFNQPLNYNPVTNAWNVSNVTDMSHMFSGCFMFNQPLNDWDVSNVTNMKQMFYECKSFNQDLSSWDVFNVEDMEEMFYQCRSFNINPNWKLDKDTKTSYRIGIAKPIDMFYRSPLEGTVLEKTYSRREADKDIRNTNTLFNILEREKRGLPEETVDVIKSYHDPLRITKTLKREDIERKIDEEVKNAILALTRRRNKENKRTPLPKDLIENIITYTDNYELSKTAKKIERNRKRNKKGETRREESHPGGGGYAGGRRKRRKRTQKRNNRK
jgi:surface protein